MEEKPTLRFDGIQVDQSLGPIQYRVEPELVRANLEAVGQAVPEFLSGPANGSLMVEPGIFVRNGIRLLRGSFKTEGVIHARAEVLLERPAAAGQLLTVTGRVAEKYVRRGRQYVVVESRTVDEKGRDVSRERNTLLLTGGEG